MHKVSCLVPGPPALRAYQRCWRSVYMTKVWLAMLGHYREEGGEHLPCHGRRANAARGCGPRDQGLCGQDGHGRGAEGLRAVAAGAARLADDGAVSVVVTWLSSGVDWTDAAA